MLLKHGTDVARATPRDGCLFIGSWNARKLICERFEAVIQRATGRLVIGFMRAT
jgi:hypothetical protein